MKSIRKTGIGVLLVMTIVQVQCKKQQKKVAVDEDEMTNTNTTIMGITKEGFGHTPEGKEVNQYVLTNKKGTEISVISYGGIITSWKALDKNGKLEDVVLGFGTLEEYTKENPFFGALIGRYGNRIAKGKFSIDGQEYSLATNNGMLR